MDRIAKTLVNNIVEHCISWLPDQQFAANMIKEIHKEFIDDDSPVIGGNQNENDEGNIQNVKDKNNLIYDHLTPMGPNSIQ